MDISFIIITDGKKHDQLSAQIDSIIKLKIPTYEITVVGDYQGIFDACFEHPNLKFVEDVFDAQRGSLGGLRNVGCAVSQYENLVISDDDMLFPKNWYQNLFKAPDFDILTTCIKNPDGTRFWDNACYGGNPHRHYILNYNEIDPELYMSGGQSWLMKKKVWEKVKWDDSILFYKANQEPGAINEDVDYSLRCREAGFKITHCKDVVVYHNDPTYTSIGRLVRRRFFQKDTKFWEAWNVPEDMSLNLAQDFLNKGLQAEAVDVLRKLRIKDHSPNAAKIIKDFEEQLGGKLDNSEFVFRNPEYEDLCNLK